MCNFGLQLISNFLILNAKVMTEHSESRAHLKGVWLATAATCQFSNQVGVRILCLNFINACRNVAESFCFSKDLFENQCAR